MGSLTTHRPADSVVAHLSTISPNDRPLLRPQGALASLLGLILLCAAFVCAAPRAGSAPRGPSQGSAEAWASSVLTGEVLCTPLAAAADLHEEEPERFAWTGDCEEGVAEASRAESDEKADAPRSANLDWNGSKRSTAAPRRRDPIVAPCCALLAPTRAPPVSPATVG